MSVFTRVLNATLFVCATATLTGCPPFEAEPLPDPDPRCQPGETRPADDGCNTCVCDEDGGWGCTERACEPQCGSDDECGPGQRCTAPDACLSPDGDPANALPECLGVCVPDDPCGPDELLVDGQCVTGCYSNQDCGDGQACNADTECLAPPGQQDGDVGLAVCYGYCEDLVIECPDIGCPPMECEFGTIRDEHGCDTCECAPPPQCEPVACQIACEFGFARGDDGCEICACNPPPACEPVACDLACEYGFITDERGCEICECAPPPVCDEELCNLACEHGFVVDENGCQTCECAPAPGCEPGFVEVDGECHPGCYGVQDCGDEQFCNADELCLPPPGDGSNGSPEDPDGGRAQPPQPAVCYGYCEDADVEPPVCAEPNAPFYYVGNSPDECSVIDFACPEGAEYFANDCGCGCIGAECYPGDQRPADDGCNTCECTDDGFWACTEIACNIDG